MRQRPGWVRLQVLILWCIAAEWTTGSAWAADPLRGERLFRQAPAPGLLGCADCHSDEPQVFNFGNIWVGRNAPALIQRAIATNTGGMGYLAATIGAQEAADIAAWLGNSPSRLMFPATALGARSAAQRVTVSSSTKTDLPGLRLQADGDFEVVASDCPADVGRFASCTVDVVFAPQAEGPRAGALLLAHPGSPTTIRLPLEGLARPRPAAIATVEPVDLALQAPAVGEPGAPRRFQLINRSAEPLTVLAVSLQGGGLTLTGGDCSAGRTLSTGEACSLGVRWTPPAAGDVQGRIEIAHDGLNNPARVTWTGSVASLAAPSLRSDRTALDLGSAHPAGETAVTWVVLENAGESTLTPSSMAATGAGFGLVDPSASMATASGLPFAGCAVGRPLPAGHRCVVAVQARPPREGRFSGLLQVRTADRSQPWQLPLSARGGAASLQASPARLEISADPAGTQATVHLVNVGAQVLDLQAARVEGEGSAWRWSPQGCGPGMRLLPAQSCTAQVSLLAGAVAPARATLVVPATTAEGGLSELRLPMRAAAREAAPLALDAPALDFGPWPIGHPVRPPARTILLQRPVGAAPSDLSSILQGSPAFQVSLACPTPPMAPTVPGPCMATARFEPPAGAAPGTHEALWSVVDPAGTLRAQATLRARVVAQAPPAPEGSAGGPAPWAIHGQPARGLDFGHHGVAVAPAVLDVTLQFAGPVPDPGGWRLQGDRSAFGLLPTGSSCLAPPSPQPCTLRVAFHPDLPGPRSAWLTHADAAVPPLRLQGVGIGAGSARVSVDPPELAFEAGSGVGQAQALALSTQGRSTAVGAPSWTGVGFALDAPQGIDCPGWAGPWWPGDACVVPVRWDGGAQALAGASLAFPVVGDDPEAVRVQLRENPALRSNEGAGGGATGPLGALALALAALLLLRLSRDPGQDPQNPMP